MKRISLTVLFFLSSFSLLFGQALDTGIQLYHEGDYKRALQIFEQSDEPLAKLFAGKSYFALGDFFKSKQQLSQLTNSSSEEFLEAMYTRALADFQLHNFAESLDLLYEIKAKHNRSSVTSASANFYNQLLDYLTLEQRFEVFRRSGYDEVRLDVLESALGKVEYGAVQAMYKSYEQSLQVSGANQNRLSSIGALISDPVAYNQRYNPGSYAKAPDGISYQLGVVLPQFDETSEQYEITQNLYFGIQMAVDRFNSENSGKKVFLTYQDTKMDPEAAPAIANDLIWNAQADAIIGPLFSEVAEEFSEYAERYETPLLLPLANSDRINLDLNYTFQFNPTFAVQGKKMARYAYQDLGYDTVAVIAEKNSLGEPSAISFYEEFSNLGGNIVRYNIQDLESQGYDIREYTSYLNPENDTTFTVDVDAIYAPFTGVVASSLINSLLTQVQAASSDITILGSEEWESIDLETYGLTDNQVFYTQSFSVAAGNMDKDQFDSEFRLRFETTPNEFAYLGFDITKVLLNSLQEVQNPAYLKKGLKETRSYKGYALDVSFDGQHINQAVRIKKIETTRN
ncbi:MAG: hypothetical protein FH748_01535 [Balneolaceae bacterium]|nr:hypothetical protein [Balneolaceae bacterium]